MSIQIFWSNNCAVVFWQSSRSSPCLFTFFAIVRKGKGIDWILRKRKMSFRLLTTRFFKHGRLLVQNYLKRDIHVNILDNGRNRGILTAELKSVAQQQQLRTSNSFLRNLGRRLFVDNVLNRVTNPYSVSFERCNGLDHDN